jgi:hypothetical protein
MVVFELGTMSPIRDAPGLFGSGAVSEVTALGKSGMSSPRQCASRMPTHIVGGETTMRVQ